MGLVSFGAGVALGYVLGNRNSTADMERARRAAAQTWQDPKVQETVRRAENAANALANELAHKSQDVLSAAAEAVKQAIAESTGASHQESSAAGAGTASSGSPAEGTPSPRTRSQDPITAATPAGDVLSDPALSTEDAGADWTDEGGSPRSATS